LTQTAISARRPRDRRQRIIAAAAEQFPASGYHNVGITDIAEAVGITSGALYRHFAGKQDLLEAAVQDAIDHLDDVWARKYAGLDELLEATCALALRHRTAGVLWAREISHLPPEVQQKLRGRLLSVVQPFRSALAAARPDLSADDVDLLLWANTAVIASVGYHSITLDPQRFQALLVTACRALCMTRALPASDSGRARTVRPSAAAALLPTSRQEAILLAATRLFIARGYQGVGVEDIGAAAGITGASVYHHFASKSAILNAALTRSVQAMFFDLFSALDARTPGEALDRVLRYLVRSTTEGGQAIGALLNEIASLPPEQRQPLRQAQLDYATEWAALLVQHRLGLSDTEAQVLVYAAMTSITSVLAIPHLRTRNGVDCELVAVGRAILGLSMDYRS
jgi:AcrR family transcriptional regulator